MKKRTRFITITFFVLILFLVFIASSKYTNLSSFENLFEILHDNNVFLIDCDKLIEIQQFKNSSYLVLNFQKFLSHSTQPAVFGIFYRHTNNLYKNVSKITKI